MAEKPEESLPSISNENQQISNHSPHEEVTPKYTAEEDGIYENIEKYNDSDDSDDYGNDVLYNEVFSEYSSASKNPYGRPADHGFADEVSSPDDTSEEKVARFQRDPGTFILNCQHLQSEKRMEEEQFIIRYLLNTNNSHSIFAGDLGSIAKLACCRLNVHVRKKALDVMLHEIFSAIANKELQWKLIINAEQQLRLSIELSSEEDTIKVRNQKMTTYAWLITLILLKRIDFSRIKDGIERFNRFLAQLPNKNDDYKKDNLFRYGVDMANESLGRILSSRNEQNEFRTSAHIYLTKCENILNSDLNAEEIGKLWRSLRRKSWLYLHICLVYLQEAWRLRQFWNDRRPIILLQILIQHACESQRLNLRRNDKRRLETIVYRVMLRIIRTTQNEDIIRQVLFGEQGCGGLITNWRTRRRPTKLPLTKERLEKLCIKAVFRAGPSVMDEFLAASPPQNEAKLILNISLVELRSRYRHKVLEMLVDSRKDQPHSHVTFEGTISGVPCFVKLKKHCKEDLVKLEVIADNPLKREIEVHSVMNDLNLPRCPNVVRLLGSSVRAPMHIITERSPKGDLKSFLQPMNIPLRAVQLNQMAVDVCDAMIFLGQRNIIHRDIRAENVFIFVEKNREIFKLGGFFRAVLSTMPNSPASPNPSDNFAVRWMAFESLHHNEFSHASDVWSFGVLLFEIFSYGSTPYINMTNGVSLMSDEEVKKYVLEGNQFLPHQNISTSVKEIIKNTMTIDKESRPTFEKLKEQLIDRKIENETYADPAVLGITNSPEVKVNLLTRPPVPPPRLRKQELAQPLPTDRPYEEIKSSGNFTRGAEDYIVMLGQSESDPSLPNEPQHYNETASQPSVLRRQRISQSTCLVRGCFGDCSTKSDDPIFTTSKHSTPCTREIATIRREDIKAFSTLDHPHLSKISDIIYHKNKVELITEVGEMRNLVDFIATYECSTEKATTLLLQIADAVAFLHDNSFIHRDLRATSVYVVYDPSMVKAKLGRFARITRDTSLELRMAEDSIRWSSPEVLEWGQYSEASDVWALAVLFWEMFTHIDVYHKEGNENQSLFLPYHDKSTKEEILSILKNGGLQRPQSCPEWLFKIMAECWKYDPSSRPPCEEIAQILKKKTTDATMWT